MTGPLAGTRVLDLTQHVAGPYCTKLLALFGATVIKVERPGVGDRMRQVGPFAGAPGGERSLAFLDLNVNKIGITLDLAHAKGKKILRDLLAGADLVVESGKPGSIGRLGFSYDEITKTSPQATLVSISNFGQTGPYRDLPASELVLYAMGHEMFGTGWDGEEPMSTAPRLNLYFAGQTAAVAGVGAVVGQRLHGRGDWVDVSIMETLLSSIDRRADSLVAFAYTGEKMTRKKVESAGILPPYTRCRDGYLHMTLGSEVQWRRLQLAVGEEWINALEYPFPVPSRAAKEFITRWRRWCLRRVRGDVVGLCQSAGVTCAPVNSVANLLEDEHLAARRYFHTLSHPVAGSAQYAGLPMRFAATPGVFWRAAPTLGQDTGAVLGELGYDAHELTSLAHAGVI
ncbi:MAG: CaiB/BaiF CoA transferase family protein [Acidimicrobiales bacterium]